MGARAGVLDDGGFAILGGVEVEEAGDVVADVVVDGVVAFEVVVVAEDVKAGTADCVSAVVVGSIAGDTATSVNDDSVAQVLIGGVVDHGATHGNVDAVAAVK